jgi:Tfp pilus assembly protein PilN
MHTINFMPYREKHRSKAKNKFILLSLSALSITMIANLAFYRISNTELEKMRTLTAGLTKQSAAAHSLKSKIQKENKILRDERSQINTIKANRKKDITTLNALTQLSDLASVNLNITLLDIKDRKISLTGMAKNYKALAMVKKYFKQTKNIHIPENHEKNTAIQFDLFRQME